MSLFEILYLSVYFIAALGLSIGVVLGLGVSLHAERQWGRWIVPSVVPVIALAIGLSAALSHRNLLFAAQHIDLVSTGGASWPLRFLTIALLMVCMARILGGAFQRGRQTPASGSGIFTAFVAFFVANNLLSSAFGTEPTFNHGTFYIIFIFTAVWAARREPLELAIDAAKWALYLFLLASLVAAKIKPNIALEPNYAGFLPGISSRLWGLGSNPNSIGPLALLCLMLEYMQRTSPSWFFLRRTIDRWFYGNRGGSVRQLTAWQRGLLRWRYVLVALAVLVFAQSKTAWSVGVVVALVLAWYRCRPSAKGHTHPAFVLLLLFGGALGVMALFAVDTGALADRLTDSGAGENLTSLSGRSQIWEVAITEWLRNPLFGYGPEIWGDAFRRKVGMGFAFSAHNQFLQSLSVAGLFGLVTLLVYLAVMIRLSWRMAERTRGVSVALMAMILMRCITENPLDVSGLFNGDVLTHIVLFLILVRAGINTENSQPQAMQSAAEVFGKEHRPVVVS